MTVRRSVVGVSAVAVLALSGCGGGSDDERPTSTATTSTASQASGSGRAPSLVASAARIAAASGGDADTGRVRFRSRVTVATQAPLPDAVRAILGQPIGFDVDAQLARGSSGQGTATLAVRGQRRQLELRVLDGRTVFVRLASDWFGVPPSVLRDFASDDDDDRRTDRDVDAVVREIARLARTRGALSAPGTVATLAGERVFRWVVTAPAPSWRRVLSAGSDAPSSRGVVRRLAPVLARNVSITLAVGARDFRVRALGARVTPVDLAKVAPSAADSGVRAVGGTASLSVSDLGRPVPAVRAPRARRASEKQLEAAAQQFLVGLLGGGGAESAR